MDLLSAVTKSWTGKKAKQIYVIMLALLYFTVHLTAANKVKGDTVKREKMDGNTIDVF